MDAEFKQIKKLYGEKMAKLCRSLFPTLLEDPGRVISALQKYFAPNHKIADDIVKNKYIDEFTKLIYKASMPDNEGPIFKTDKTPFQLLKEQGYTLYECKKESEIQSFKKYYESSEKLCTFIGGQRLFTHRVFFAVKDNIEKIERSTTPQREDEYSLSLLCFQFTRGKDFNPVSVKSRYNHSVKHPDAVFHNNLDMIAKGLSYSFTKHYGFKLQAVDANTYFIDEMRYASDYRGVFHRWNYERNALFYLDNNLILSYSGRLITDYADKARFIFMDEFILDRKEKKIIGNKYSGFYRTTVMGEIVSTEHYTEKSQNLTIIHFDNGKFVKIWTYKNGLIKAYENNFTRQIHNNFLPYNRVIKSITARKARICGNDFLIANDSLEVLDTPLLRKIFTTFLPKNTTLKDFTALNIKEIGDHFMFQHPYFNRRLCLEVGHQTHKYPEIDPRVLRRAKNQQKYTPRTERRYAKISKRLKMSKYYSNLNSEVKEYFSILSPEFPDWLLDYINTPEMERISKISISCGTDYSGCFDIKYFYSNLDHSVGVALIIWNFTHDKKQTLAGLFHDIATPVFKHCIDFMNGDSEKQESTEERTTEFIKNSKEIMSLLDRDQIKLEEVNDYKMYPIADNDTPQLSADRFEYTFSSGLTFYRIWDLDLIKKIYNNIVVLKNENGVDELAFKDKEVCDEYISIISKIWPEWVSDRDRITMQFLADMCKSMSIAGYLTVDDLYTLSEREVINRFITAQDEYLSNCFREFQAASVVHRSEKSVDGTYCVNVTSKTRYVDPLVLTKDGVFRISKISENASNLIKQYLELEKGGYYTYFDFDFKPYDGVERKRD